MNLISRWKQISKLKKFLIILLSLVTAYTIIGFVCVPAALKYGLVHVLEKNLGRKASIREIAFNPYALTLQMEGFTILDHDGEVFFSLDRLSADVRGWQSLTKMAGVVSEVDMEYPQVRIVMNKDGSFNFSDLVPAAPQPMDELAASEPGKKNKPPRILLEIASIQGGNFIFEDRQKNVSHRVSDFFLAVRDVSGLPDDKENPSRINLEASINGAPLVVEAQSVIFDPSLKSSASVIFNKISAQPYMAYISTIEGRKLVSADTQAFVKLEYFCQETGQQNLTIHTLNLKNTQLAWNDSRNDPAMPDIRGPYKILLDRFSMGMVIQVNDPATMDIQVKNTGLALDNLKLLAQNGALALARIDHFDIKDTNVDLASSKASIGALTTYGGWFAAALESEKRIDITRIIELPSREKPVSAIDETVTLEIEQALEESQDTAKAIAAPQAPSAAVTEDAPDIAHAGDVADTPPEPEGIPEQAGSAWIAEVTSLDLDDYTFFFKDLSIAQPVSLTVTDMSLHARNFSSVPGNMTDISFSLKANEQGVISGTGQVSLDPISSQMEVHCKNAGLVFLSPYLQEFLDALLKGAEFTLDGKTTFAMKDDIPLATFQGNASVSGFDFATRQEKNLADWKILTIDGISVQSEPLSATIDEIRLKDLTSWVILEKDGSINYANLMKKDLEAEARDSPPPPGKVTENGRAPAEKEAQPLVLPDILVKKFVLENGKIYFQDKSIEPGFTTELGSLNGTITNISSNPDIKAEILLTGQLNNHAVLNITGWGKPLTIPPSGKVVLGFKNIEMAPLSPYTAKYIGYRLSKGKLTLAHEYLYHEGLINGENLIIIDQLTLGEKVDSPDAIKAPIELALALLKDSNGRIELPVPITGDPQNPQFKLGKVISKALANVIIKVITSPFAALGALVGGGEELAYLDFQPGMAQVNPEGMEKLAKLTKALQERPLLKLDIQGHTDPDLDREAITKARYTALLNTAKKQAMGKKGEQIPLDQITITAEEREDIVWAVYKKAEFEKEKNVLGMVKKIELADMEAMLIQSVTPKDDDLVQLAWQRSQAAKGIILEGEKIEATRVFIVEPPPLTNLNKETKNCRAGFSLKR
ncbi:MAG: DUF748 domain-containing protein [Desulfatibacillum sp.]|nr:DUF748 domain-containing protein [Desulfatibacillum sp.]